MASEPFGNDGMDDFLSKAEGIYGGEGPDSLVTSTDAAVAMYGGTGDDQLIMLSSRMPTRPRERSTGAPTTT